jgi:hypothetical protein
MASYHLPTNETMRLPPASSMVPQISISQNNHPSPAFFTTMDNTNNNINTSNTSNDNERVRKIYIKKEKSEMKPICNYF